MKNLEESIQEKGPSKSCGRSCSLGWYCRKSLAKTQGGGGRGGWGRGGMVIYGELSIEGSFRPAHYAKYDFFSAR